MKTYRINLQEAYIITKEYAISGWWYRIKDIVKSRWQVIRTNGLENVETIMYKDYDDSILLQTDYAIDNQHINAVYKSTLAYLYEEDGYGNILKSRT